jgi:penicillin-binding protein A
VNLERRLWRIGNLVVLLLVLLSTRVVYWQLVRGEELRPTALQEQTELKKFNRSYEDVRRALKDPNSAENLQNLPQPVVQRTQDMLETITRGNIYDRNRRLLASDRLGEQGERYRFYSEPSLAPVIGYVNGMRIGVAGLEETYNQTLLGLDRADTQLGRLIHQPLVGSDLVLTIDSRIQRAAESALQGKAGAVIVLDGQSAAVLALASAPRYDPNRVLESDYISNLLQSCDGSPLCQAPLLNRATQALYPPGSTWKTVSLIAALDTGQVTPDTVFDFGQPVSGPNGSYYVYQVDGGTIPDPNHKESKLNLEMSYAKSANAAFARIGDEMPPDVMIDYAARLGFSAPEPFPLEIASSPSLLARDTKNLYSNNLLRAATAIGQGELLASPLNMGMVVLSVLNKGSLPVPYFVQSVRDPSGNELERTPNDQVLQDIMNPETAQEVRRMMISVVEKGSGTKAAVQGMTVGGKTGTAQVGGDALPHAWFAGFAEQGERSVVIVVLIENGGEGSQVAAPIFAKMAQTALSQSDQPVEEIVPTPTPPAEEPNQSQAAVPAQPTASPTPENQEQPVATQAPQPTVIPTQASGFDVPPPDIPYDPNKTDFTERGSATCPGNQQGPVGSGKFIWPSVYQALSGGSFREGHPGIDLSTPAGTPVYAADAGLVIFAGWTGVGYGNTVVIDHGNGYRTLYGHLSQVSTYCGAKVQAGKLIGLSGSTGNSTGPHLHFEVRVPGGYLDPLKVLPTP